jgi:DNA-binding PadR family transcriptional regulator
MTKMNVPLALLGLLTIADLHGYDLKQLCDRLLSPGRPIKQGQVYATLHRLERDGNIAVVGIEQEEGPERRRYALTQRGRIAVAEWLTNPEPAAPYLQSALYAKVIVALIAGFAVEQLIDAQRASHLQRMRELTVTRRSASLPEVLLSDFALFHLEADIRWLDMTAARVAQIKQEVESGLQSAGIALRPITGRTNT